MRVLVCGDRSWSDWRTLREYVDSLPSDAVVIEGDCRGADKMAGWLARQRGLEVLVFPADWQKYGKAAGAIRNQQMLEEGKPEEVRSFHVDIRASRGTKDMLRRSLKTGLPCYLHDSQK